MYGDAPTSDRCVSIWPQTQNIIRHSNAASPLHIDLIYIDRVHPSIERHMKEDGVLRITCRPPIFLRIQARCVAMISIFAKMIRNRRVGIRVFPISLTHSFIAI